MKKTALIFVFFLSFLHAYTSDIGEIIDSDKYYPEKISDQDLEAQMGKLAQEFFLNPESTPKSGSVAFDISYDMKFEESNILGDSRFGYSLSTAGDVNGDGYDDIIVGAYYFNYQVGRSYIYFGGSSIDSIADIIMDGEDNSNQFGYSVSTAGDVNGDGYDDVIVGALQYNTNTGRSYIYYGGSSMDNMADIIMDGEVSGDRFGYSVSNAGDVNGDGYSDVIVSAPYYNSFNGRSYIYFGGINMDNIVDVFLDGEGGLFGGCLSTAGDVNGDGYSDIIIGAYIYNSQIGRSYIYFGGSTMDHNVDLFMDGESTMNRFGRWVSSAGDVNGDGYDDVIIAADGYNSNTGRSYIYYGSASMDNVSDILLDGENTSDLFGRCVSTAGDVNADGFDDVIIGVYGYNSNTGRSYIYYGGITMDNVADITMEGEGGYYGEVLSNAGDINGDGYDDVIVSAWYFNSQKGRSYIYCGDPTMDNVANIIIDGEGSNNCFGFSVSNAGDVNRDGYEDIIVGANSYNSNRGISYIYFGGVENNNVADIVFYGQEPNNWFGYSVSNAGDVNGDNYDDVIIGESQYNGTVGRAYIYYGGETMDNTADVTMDGEGYNNYYGRCVNAAGDLNGDGYDDVVVESSNINSGTGRIYIYYGGSDMDNLVDLSISGETTYNSFGISVSLAGDVNGDGNDDLIVGAHGYNSYTGRCYIYYGGESMDNIADITLNGESVNNAFGVSVSDLGDINGDGYDDVVVGACNYSSSTGRSYIFYGGNSMDNIADVILTGENTYNYFGQRVSAANDINADGYNDVLISAYGYNSYTGRCYIYYGGESMDNIADVILDGESTQNYFGYSVSNVGDFNGDIGNDICVGAYKYPYNGAVYAYYGIPEFSIDSCTPFQNQQNTIANSNISVTFNDNVDVATVDENTFVIYGSATGLISGAYSGGGTNIITFNPANDFKAGEVITVTLTRDLKSTGGAVLEDNYTWQFTVKSDPVGGIFNSNAISTSAINAWYVHAADIDSDGDMDALSASPGDDKIAWYENDGSESFAAHTISTTADGAKCVYAIDVDTDGDMDILSASYMDDKIAWYENNGSENFTEHSISTTADGIESVFAIDVDSDGDIDVLSACTFGNKIAWYENDGSEGFTEHVISSAAQYALSVYAVDIDNDGDIDVVSASQNDDKIAWYENDGNESFTEHAISTSADGATSVHAVDVDSDGDMDVLSTSRNDDKIAWYENDGNENFTEHSISTLADQPWGVYAGDVDGDGDMDILSASYADDKIAWYENDGNENFTDHTISLLADAAICVYAADMDNDGDLDILSASIADAKIAWYENSSPVPTINTQPLYVEICAGESTSFSISATDAENYQWQVDEGIGFIDITEAEPYSGVSSNTLAISVAEYVMNQNEYRCVANNTWEETTSDPVILTVSPVYNETDAASICDGDSYSFGTQTLTTTGDYTEVFESVLGCDSTVVLIFTVNPVYNEVDAVSVCSGESYMFGTQTLTEPGEYIEVFESIDGCDSTVTLTFTVNPVYNETDAASICDGESYIFGTQTLTTSGDYTELFESVSGCDSTVVLTLTVNSVYNELDAVSICSGESYTFGTQTLTESGEYVEVFESVYGCDSTVTLTLTVNSLFNEIDVASICDGESYTFGTQTLTSAGDYTELFESVSGCDSTVVLTLTVNPVYNEVDTVSVCSGESYTFGTQTLTESGEYVEVFESVTGCDSTVTLTFKVNPGYTQAEDQIICEGESYLWHETDYNSTGTYYAEYLSVNGCDSIFTLDLIVQDLPSTPTITQEENTLTSSAIEGNQWYLDDTEIENATNQSYIAIQEGDYFVIVTGENQCISDQSNVITVAFTGISDLRDFQVKIYPNPVKDKLTIENGFYKPMLIEIYDLTGTMKVNEILTGHISEIDLSSLKSSIYLMKITIQSEERIVKFIKN